MFVYSVLYLVVVFLECDVVGEKTQKERERKMWSFVEEAGGSSCKK